MNEHESEILMSFLVWRLSDILPDILVLSGSRISNILVFCSHVYSQLKIISNEKDGDMNYSIKKLIKKNNW